MGGTRPGRWFGNSLMEPERRDAGKASLFMKTNQRLRAVGEKSGGDSSLTKLKWNNSKSNFKESSSEKLKKVIKSSLAHSSNSLDPELKQAQRSGESRSPYKSVKPLNKIKYWSLT